ncbi:hypothetical protein QYM18_06315 [Ectopseudomonas chengduensis]|nr:hypothetical protein [Pseudomonas chengduensis]WKC38698.1 hypothetical protein QYM18_06315 [Pseudomonas chengduensis]
MAYAIFTTLASLASLIGLALQLYKNKEKPLTYFLLSIALLCSFMSATLLVINSQLESENAELLNARLEANKLLSSWPKVENFDFTSDGEFRGVVISGMAFLEANREIFPETYTVTKSLMFNELEASSNKDENYVSKRSKLQEAAEAMITAIKAIRVKVVSS